MNERIRELADQVLPNEKEFHQGDPKDWGYFFSGDELEKFAELIVKAEPVEPVAQYSDIVSDGGMDSRNKYDTAPPQRKLVPLTEEEIDRIDACIDESTPLKEGKRLFARAIENASWEKNHG